MLRRKALFSALTYAGGLLVLTIFIGPILWFIALAIRPAETAFAMPPQFTFQPGLDAFRHILVNPGTNAPQLVNSLIVAIGAVALNLPFSVPAAYALSRFKVRGKKNIMLWYLGLLMAPPIAFLIPYFILITRVGLQGTYLSMVLVLQTITIPSRCG